MTLQDALAHVADLARAVARGDSLATERLQAMTANETCPPAVVDLAEQINMIVVQKEVREFHLETLIEELLAAQSRLEAARQDPVTQLPNRALFHDLLDGACADAVRTGQPAALLFIDLDRFKAVNDTLGHDAGDELLGAVAGRLADCVRTDDILARLGGDEFTAVLRHLSRPDIAVEVAQRMVSVLAQPFMLAAGPAQIGASVGISFCPDDADRPTALLKNADVAMYRAKTEGRNAYRLYREPADEASRDVPDALA